MFNVLSKYGKTKKKTKKSLVDIITVNMFIVYCLLIYYVRINCIILYIPTGVGVGGNLCRIAGHIRKLKKGVNG